MQPQQQQPRSARMLRLKADALTQGTLVTERHIMHVLRDRSVVRVLDRGTDLFVAWSEGRADFDQSLEEFILDYMLEA